MSLKPRWSYADWLTRVNKYGYEGFLNARNFSSSATASEFYSIKNRRMVYAASPPEKKRMYDHEFSSDVTSYYDQFPIPPEISMTTCQEWGL